MSNLDYRAGSEAELPHVVKIRFSAETLDITRSDLIARWIEFWCQTNCDHQWRVVESQAQVEVFFENEQDLVFFKLSPEFDLS